MHEYNFTTDKWYVVNENDHGKLEAGLWLAVPLEVTEWFDNYSTYVDGCLDNGVTPEPENITPVDNN